MQLFCNSDNVTFFAGVHHSVWRAIMEATITYLDGVKFEAEARGHRVVCDQPTDNGGADEGMTPPEFMLASLGTCAGFYAVQYLKARKLPVEDVSVKVIAEKVLQPARLGAFKIEVNVPHLEDERHREGVLRAVKSCLIHNTLLHAPSIEIELQACAPTIEVGRHN
jgi:uncharacterized OsmC-like protein